MRPRLSVTIPVSTLAACCALLAAVASAQDPRVSAQAIYYEHFTTSPAIQTIDRSLPPTAQLSAQFDDPVYADDPGMGFTPLPQVPGNPNGVYGSPELPQQPHTFYESPTPDQVFPDGGLAIPPPVRLYQTQTVGTWIPAESNEIGMTEIGVRGTFVFTNIPLLTVTPGIEFTILDGPTRTDLPGQLYGAQVEVRWARLPGAASRWGYELVVAPGYYSDFERNDADAVRITGRAVGFYAQSPGLQWVFGLAYLDRENILFLPIFGAIYIPREDVRLELIFPRPKLAQRIRKHPGGEQWIYLAGEFGGDSWAIERASGREDIATIGDWRLTGGLEMRRPTGQSLFFELGFVFHRELEYESDIGNFDPDPSALFRIGAVF